MALWHWVLFWVLAPVAALALDLRPAESPPDDFAARQYIDSRGCVFLRDDGQVWTARLARDGSPICGYPPSSSLRGAEGKPKLRVLDPDLGKSRADLVSEALERVVTTGLREGELVSDPRPLERLPDMGPEPHSEAPMDDLRAALRAAPAIRQQMGRDLKPNRRLCELLGYDATIKAGAESLGHDPTKGYCASLPDIDLSRLAFERPAKGMKEHSGERAAANPVTPARTGLKALEARKKPTATPSKPASGRKDAPRVGSTGRSEAAAVGMIPPGARHVQIGTYAKASNADRAARRATGLGYPVLRGTHQGKSGQVQVILAGPFGSREAIVKALDGLRKAGFRDAYPR